MMMYWVSAAARGPAAAFRSVFPLKIPIYMSCLVITGILYFSSCLNILLWCTNRAMMTLYSWIISFFHLFQWSVFLFSNKKNLLVPDSNRNDTIVKTNKRKNADSKSLESRKNIGYFNPRLQDVPAI